MVRLIRQAVKTRVALCQRQPHERFALCHELAVNGDTPPEWIQILPIGPAIAGADGRKWTLGDADAFVKSFNGRIPLDYEHATELRAPKGEEAPAAGWIEELQAVKAANAQFPSAGIWGRVEWTPRGANSVTSREYRYQSPVFTHTKAGAITKLLSVAVTNRPNLELTALNRASEPAPKENTMDEEQRKALCARLGLPADTNIAVLSSALNARLEANATETKAAQKRATDAETALNARQAEDFARDVEVTIEAAKTAGKISPASEAPYRAMCTSQAGLDGLKAVIATLPSIHTTQTPTAKPAGLATNAGGRVLAHDELAFCRQMNITPDEMIAGLSETFHGGV